MLHNAHATIEPVSSAPSKPDGGAALAGFMLSGFLLALLGAILPAWGYHRDPPDFVAVGNYFLSLAAGLVVAGAFAPRVIARRGLAFLLVFACVLSCAALAYLALVSPPASAWWRVVGLLVLGAGAGVAQHGPVPRHLAHLPGRRRWNRRSRAGSGTAAGCLAATLLVAGTFYAYTVPSILVLMAVVPGVFAGLYARGHYALPAGGAHRSLREVVEDFRSPGAILFALLLFFQFGNEWSLAGWLPLFLIRRVGMSPSGALLILALYWLFLIAGRLGAVAILPRVRPGRLLLASVMAALFGCLILISTKNGFGAASGVLFLGAGYASVYPLVAGGHRQPVSLLPPRLL